MIEINGKIDTNDLEFVKQLQSRGLNVPKGDPVMAAPCPRNYADGAIKPNTTRFLFKSGQMMDIVHVKPIYYEMLNGQFASLRDVTYGFGNRWANLKEDWDTKMHPRFLSWWMKRMELIGGSVNHPFPKIGMKPLTRELINFTVTTFYPDPSVENTSVDGFTARDGVNETFTTIRDGAGTTSDDSGTNLIIRLASSSTTDQFSQMIRSATLFDTSALGSGATIDSAIISGEGNAVIDNMDCAVTVIVCAPADDTAVVAGDYPTANWTMTQQNDSDIDITSFSSSAYNDFTLNSTGEGNISKTSITKFGFVIDKDRLNTAPTWASDVQALARMDSADTSDTSQDPKLAVTFTGAATPASLKTFNTTTAANVKTADTVTKANFKTWNTVT